MANLVYIIKLFYTYPAIKQSELIHFRWENKDIEFLLVTAVNAATKEINVKFGGAESGNYKLIVSNKYLPLLKAELLRLTSRLLEK